MPAGKIATLKTQGLCGHAGSWKLKVAGKKCVEVSNLLSLAGCKASSMNAVVILADACHQCAQLHLDIPSFSSCTRTIKKIHLRFTLGTRGKGLGRDLGARRQPSLPYVLKNNHLVSTFKGLGGRGVRGWFFVEGSLEVKLPTIWRDEKQSRAEAERRGRLEERRSEEKE